MGGVILGLLISVSCLVGTLVVRWLTNRPEPSDGIPITPEELQREKPDYVCVDISYEYLDPLLESIEDTVDWGFTEAQRISLVQRIVKLQRHSTTSAIFPVQYNDVASDLLMQFMRVDRDVVRCKFQCEPVLVAKLRELLSKTPQVQVFRES